ncbi:MAG: leucine-rich repeat domain-containing protein [Prevotella sp.]|nr:leucine-rich repeat domain-containing protein [Prevotella sp.]
MNYVNDGNDINPSALDNLYLNSSMVDKIVFTGDWANSNCQKLGEIVGKFAYQQDPVFVDLSACTQFVSKFVSVQDYYDQAQDGYDNVNTVFNSLPNFWEPSFSLDKCREDHKMSGISFPKSENFTFIPNNLLIGSQNLKKVVIPEGVVAIGNNAFGGSPVEELTLPNTITEIGNDAFKGAKITALDLSKMKLSKVRAEAFLDCTQLASVKFPNTITEIQRMAFQRTPVKIVDLRQCHDLRLLAYQCFSECTSLDSVIVCSHEKVIRGSNTIDANGYHAGGGAFYNARNIKVVEIKYCNGTDVTKCWCENAAFDYDITHVQTRLDRIPEACKLIYPKGDNASAPYKSNFDFFVGEYKTNAVIRQSNLLKYWRYIPARGQNVAELPNGLATSYNLNNYKGNGWLEFLSTGEGEVIDKGEFLRTYSRTFGDGPCLLPKEITAYRAVDYTTDQFAFVLDRNGEYYYDATIQSDNEDDKYVLIDGIIDGITDGIISKEELAAIGDSKRYSHLTIGGKLYLRPLVAKVAQYPGITGGYEEDNIELFDEDEVYNQLQTVTGGNSYVPEETGVVLYSKGIDEEAFLIMSGDFGTDIVYKKFPHTGNRYESGRLNSDDTSDNINMLQGSFEDGWPVSPVYPWKYKNESTYVGGHYPTDKPREFRNFACVMTHAATGTGGLAERNTYGWKRLQPSRMKGNRAFAQIPASRFDNFNEDADSEQFPGFTIEDTAADVPAVDGEGTQTANNSNTMLISIFEDDSEDGADVDGIKEVKSVRSTVAKTEDNAWYTLQGVRVSSLTKGVYIHNGKKVVIK